MTMANIKPCETCLADTADMIETCLLGDDLCEIKRRPCCCGYARIGQWTGGARHGADHCDRIVIGLREYQT